MPNTLTVNFTLANPDPGSYRVKFWPTSNPSNITTRLVSNSPFQESGLTECCYAGTIESSCGSNQYSSPVSFSANYDYFFYNATKFDCGNSCAQVGATGSIVVRSSTFLSPGNALYYKSGPFTYQLTNIIAVDPLTYDVNLDGTTSGANCNTVCGTAGTGDLFIQNQTAGTITFGDFTPAWFLMDGGSVGAPYSSATGSHSGYVGNMSINVASVTINGCLAIRVNGIVVADNAVSGAGIYQFNNLNIASTDAVSIQFLVTCP